MLNFPSQRVGWLTGLALVTATVVNAGEPGCDFTNVTLAAGLDYEHGDLLPTVLPQFMGGGVASGDYDGDGWIDLYVVSGTAGANMLWRNLGDGTFVDRATLAGVDISASAGSGPTFADLDGDGHLDLVIGDLRGGRPTLFRNRGDGTFEDRSAGSGLPDFPRVFSIAAGDYDRDGDLDLFFSQWNEQPADLLWRNDGDFRFRSATADVLGSANQHLLRTFSPNFAELDGDGWPDLVVASDFGNSQVLLSNGDGTLRRATDPAVIIDENGMGAALGDYDGDGDLDWFVSSIYDPDDPFHQLGNRLYRNRGDGLFDDVTATAGVYDGDWGWGSCWADFDNDGRLDIFHGNGWRDGQFADDPSRLFLQNPDQTFSEQASACGIDDRGQGRGVVCFDYDQDHDIDIFVANNSGSPRLYRNNAGSNAGNLLTVELLGPPSNRHGIGARLLLTSAGQEQLREVRVGSNYASQDPAIAYFGVGGATSATRLVVEWQDRRSSTVAGVAVNQHLVVNADQVFVSSFESGNLAGWSDVVSGP